MMFNTDPEIVKRRDVVSERIWSLCQVDPILRALVDRYLAYGEWSYEQLLEEIAIEMVSARNRILKDYIKVSATHFQPLMITIP